jgi:hypothetical protein
MDNLVALGALGLALLGVWLWLRHAKRRSSYSERQLHRICLGDDSKVERLIEAEMMRVPGISRGDAASRVVDRYQRDNR